MSHGNHASPLLEETERHAERFLAAVRSELAALATWRDEPLVAGRLQEPVALVLEHGLPAGVVADRDRDSHRRPRRAGRPPRPR